MSHRLQSITEGNETKRRRRRRRRRQRAKKTLKYRRVAVRTNERTNERTKSERNQAAKKRIPSHPNKVPHGVKRDRCSDCDETLISQFALISYGAGRCQLPWMFWQPSSSELLKFSLTIQIARSTFSSKTDEKVGR